MDRLVVRYTEINTVICWWSCVWISVVDAVRFMLGRRDMILYTPFD